MTKSELKKVLKPLIKECIKEVIFEDGVLSGLITEVAHGLGGVINSPLVAQHPTHQPIKESSSKVLSAKKQLDEMKSQLQEASGLKGIFEGTKPLASQGGGQSSKYGALRDKDPGDAGVNIDGLINMTGGWSHLT